MIYYPFNFFKTKGAKLLPKYGSPAFACKCLDIEPCDKAHCVRLKLPSGKICPCINTFAAGADKWDIFELTIFAQISPSVPTASELTVKKE